MEVVLFLVVVVVSSRQPNQPGVVQVEVDEPDVLVVLWWLRVVDSSIHPHHPGVLHVSVRVLDDLDLEVLVGLLELVVVVSVPLLSKYSHV